MDEDKSDDSGSISAEAPGDSDDSGDSSIDMDGGNENEE